MNVESRDRIGRAGEWSAAGHHKVHLCEASRTVEVSHGHSFARDRRRSRWQQLPVDSERVVSEESSVRAAVTVSRLGARAAGSEASQNQQYGSYVRFHDASRFGLPAEIGLEGRRYFFPLDSRRQWREAVDPL